jgi:hypothetical protein
MSFFAYHCLETLLISTGGPKRKGLFNSEAVFDSAVVDSGIRQAINYGACLGACNPATALSVLATVYKDRDWSGSDAPQIKSFIEGAKEEWGKNTGKAPYEIIPPISFSKHTQLVSVKQLHDREFQAIIEQMFVESLLWGLVNPGSFKTWYEKDFARIQDNMPRYKEAGLDVDFNPTLDQYTSESQEMLKDYELKMGKLSKVPPELIQVTNDLELEVV